MSEKPQSDKIQSGKTPDGAKIQDPVSGGGKSGPNHPEAGQTRKTDQNNDHHGGADGTGGPGGTGGSVL